MHISQQVGRLWRNLSNDSREVYAKEARRLQSLHSLEFPDYKYQPRRRLRTPEGEEIDPHPSPLRQAISSQPPSKPPIVVNQYVVEYLRNDSPRCRPKSSPSWEFNSGERHLTHGLLDFNASCSNPNMDTLTSLQASGSQREDIKQHQHEGSNIYQSSFNYSDGVANRLGWMGDRLVEPLGPPPSQMNTPVATSSILPSEDLFAANEHWYQYHKEGSFGDALPLPGIETWTFSGSAI